MAQVYSFLFKQKHKLKYTTAVLYKSGNHSLILQEEQFNDVLKCSAHVNMWTKVKGRQTRVEKTA
jgi:hypothetical protein